MRGIDLVVHFAAESHVDRSILGSAEDRKGHDRRYSVDITKIRTELGYEPKVSFDTGLAETVRWYEDNRAWWERLKERATLVGK